MTIKKDVQQTIVEKNGLKSAATEEEFYNILKMIAPGTNIRTALDGVLRAGKGALIVVENESLPRMSDGGFRLNARFTPQKLIELSKMDGAIILSKDMRRIVLANTLLTPSSKIPSNETGTRHKAAERVAKEAGTLALAISERRNEVTLYYKNIKYSIVDSGELLRKANEHIQMLEKQREIFDKALDRLDKFEFRNHPSLGAAVQVIQKGKMVQKISAELRKYIIELGKESSLLKTRLKEITSDVERETELVIKDYTQLNLNKTRDFLDKLSYEELLDKEKILTAMAYESAVQKDLVRGWRILSKTCLQEGEIAAVIKEAGSLGKVLYSRENFYSGVINEDRFKTFKNEIQNIKMNHLGQ